MSEVDDTFFFDENKDAIAYYDLEPLTSSLGTIPGVQSVPGTSYLNMMTPPQLNLPHEFMQADLNHHPSMQGVSMQANDMLLNSWLSATANNAAVHTQQHHQPQQPQQQQAPPQPQQQQQLAQNMDSDYRGNLIKPGLFPSYSR